MFDIETERKLFHSYFNKFSTFDNKDFDIAMHYVKNCADNHGLSEEELILVTNHALPKKLAIFRLRKVIQSLIPITYVPEEAIRNVIRWLLNNYNKPISPLALKIVLQWFAGLIEHNLVQTDVINLYYDVYYYFITNDIVCSSACRLIYLLTKPEDVSRWYVKQVLKVHIKNMKPKYTGALLYLFKTYQPSCVPENIKAYAVHNAFGPLPSYFITGFTRAKQRIAEISSIPEVVNNIVWIKPDTAKKTIKMNFIQLIPSVSQTENDPELELNGCKSLLSITNVNELHKYHLSSSTPNRVLSLLNNSAGFHILAFSSDKIQARFSYQLYDILYDAFLQRNPLVSYEEKDKILKQLSLFQIHLQQSIPVVSRFLAQYIARWDGREYEEHVYRLLQWLHVSSFNELRECILSYLYDIFISGSLETKCKIVYLLGCLEVNFMILYFNRSKKENTRGLFLGVTTEWNFENLIMHLHEFNMQLCELGLFLENNHNVLLNSIISMHSKVFTAQQMIGTNMWNIPTNLCYSALFSRSPTALNRMCELINRFPKSVESCVKDDFLDCLWNEKAFIPQKEKSIFYELDEPQILFKNQIFESTKCLSLERHFGLACYNYSLLKGGTKKSVEFDELIKNGKIHFRDICYFCLKNLK